MFGHFDFSKALNLKIISCKYKKILYLNILQCINKINYLLFIKYIK